MSRCADRSSSRGRPVVPDLRNERKSFAARRTELPIAGHRRAGSQCTYYLPRIPVGKEGILTYSCSYDPHLKAGASFYATLPLPPDLLERDETHERRLYEYGGKVSLDGTRTFIKPEGKRKSVTWIIEIISQVLFSPNATVGYEILLGRDEKCLSFGYPLGSVNTSAAGMERLGSAEGGVLSRAVTVLLQDEKELWNSPAFPTWEDQVLTAEEKGKDPDYQDEVREKRRQGRKGRTKKVHLVILTHGIHGNTGADMLFLKETIDDEERKAAIVRREQREKDLAEGKISEEQAEDDDSEQVIVRGYHGNCCRTERGIEYLGKRLARYVLHLAHPNHNPIPTKSYNKLQKPRKLYHHPHLTPDAREPIPHAPQYDKDPDIPPYKITSISFLGHSLGGLVQTYAIAYIHAHSPTFFHKIKPVNFIAFATPFLGLSHENPIYVKFALDFGLVGKTGQDLGLTWRAPSAFSVFTGNGGAARTGPDDHSSKPLLRILPTGPAHEALKLFRSRTVYANVVNDGIVPLRTSCLLFLDWKGLGKVEKARRENGPVGGLVEWGWGQLVTNGPSVGVASKATSPTPTTSTLTSPGFTLLSPLGTSFWGKSSDSSDTTQQLEEQNPVIEAPLTGEPTARERSSQPPTTTTTTSKLSTPNPFSSIITLFHPQGGSKPSKPAGKIYHRSQTVSPNLSATSSTTTLSAPSDEPTLLQAPPRTSLLEAAGDALNPPLPTVEFIIDPSSRPRTIFHDRVYHADDIPPPPPRMQVEEKIARAYHKDLSWRKVLVRLEPDAHNNLIVRRMFANAYGWPVVQHAVETHFGLSYAATTLTDQEAGGENAPTAPPGKDVPAPKRTSRTSTATSWPSATFRSTDVSSYDDEEEEEEEDVDATLQSFLEVQPKQEKDVEKGDEGKGGLVEVSKVFAEGTGRVGLGLGMRNSSFGGANGGGWGERWDGGAEGERSEAVRMLEMCGGKGKRSGEGRRRSVEEGRKKSVEVVQGVGRRKSGEGVEGERGRLLAREGAE